MGLRSKIKRTVKKAASVSKVISNVVTNSVPRTVTIIQSGMNKTVDAVNSTLNNQFVETLAKLSNTIGIPMSYVVNHFLDSESKIELDGVKHVDLNQTMSEVGMLGRVKSFKRYRLIKDMSPLPFVGDRVRIRIPIATAPLLNFNTADNEFLRFICVAEGVAGTFPLVYRCAPGWNLVQMHNNTAWFYKKPWPEGYLNMSSEDARILGYMICDNGYFYLLNSWTHIIFDCPRNAFTATQLAAAYSVTSLPDETDYSRVRYKFNYE